MVLESSTAIEAPRKVRFAPNSPHQGAQNHGLQKGEMVKDDGGGGGVQMQKQLSCSKAGDSDSLDPLTDMVLDNTVEEAPRKVKFAPKTPQRREQSIGFNISENVNVEESGGVGTRLRSLEETSVKVKPKVETKAAQTKLVFGYGDEVHSVKSHGSPKNGDEVQSLDLLSEEEFRDASETVIKDEHSIKPAVELGLEVSAGSKGVFAQDVVSINTEEKYCCNVGELGNRMIITPDVDSITKDQLHFDHDDHSTSKLSCGLGANSSEPLSVCSLPDLAGATPKSPGSVSLKSMFPAAIGKRVIVDPYADFALTPMDQMYTHQINCKLARLARRRFLIAKRGVGPEVQERLNVLDKESKHLEQFLLRVNRMRVQQYTWPISRYQHPFDMETPILKVPCASLSHNGTIKKAHKSATAGGRLQSTHRNDAKQEVKNAPTVGQPDGLEAADEVARGRAQPTQRSGLKRASSDPNHPEQRVKIPRCQAIDLPSSLEKGSGGGGRSRDTTQIPTSDESTAAKARQVDKCHARDPAGFDRGCAVTANILLYDASKTEQDVCKTAAVKAEEAAAVSANKTPLPSPNEVHVTEDGCGARPIITLSGTEIGYLIDYMDYTFSVIDE